MYLRWIVDLSPQQEAGEKIGHIIEQNRTAKSNVIQLRRKLLDLENEAEKIGVLTEKMNILKGEQIDNTPEERVEKTSLTEENRAVTNCKVATTEN